MRKYLSEIHTKPDKHKKRFAFFVSLGITLFIFSLWSMTAFLRPEEPQVANEPEVSFFGSLATGVGAAIGAIRGDYSEVRPGLVPVNTYNGR